MLINNAGKAAVVEAHACTALLLALLSVWHPCKRIKLSKHTQPAAVLLYRLPLLAGLSRVGPVIEQPLSEVQEIFDANLFGVVRVTQASAGSKLPDTMT